MPRPRKFAELEDALGCRFKDKKLYERALTHASVHKGRAPRIDNERLEFLGDRVLGLVIAGHLHTTMPDVREGDLARRFNRMVCGDACTEVARSIDLGKFLILSEAEADSGGRDKDTILADAMEAVLGAVYIDQGYEIARRVVELLWEPLLQGAGVTRVDPKSALQEWAQGKGMKLPKYVELSRKGPDHAPRFISEVRVEGLEPVHGEGTSKRQAEQAAAAAAYWKEKRFGRRRQRKRRRSGPDRPGR